MAYPPYVTRWIDGLCYWVRFSNRGSNLVGQSRIGFLCEAEAVADFLRLHA